MAPSRSESPARKERLALCDLFEEQGPLAPTLCESWTTSDLAAHLFIRESRPWAGVGILVPQLSGYTRHAMDEAKRRIGYEGLVSRLRAGPSGPLKSFDGAMNFVEYFVHHEDVRRAVPNGETASRDDSELDAALWANVKRSGWLMGRKAKDVGLLLVAPGQGEQTIRNGSPVVTMRGGPQEIVLYLFGRKTASHVELDGPAQAKLVVEEAPFGF